MATNTPFSNFSSVCLNTSMFNDALCVLFKDSEGASSNDTPIMSNISNVFIFHNATATTSPSSSNSSASLPLEPRLPRELLDTLNWVKVIVSLGVGLPGILLNVVNIVVWSQPCMRRSPSALYMTVLATSDLLYLAISIVFSTYWVLVDGVLHIKVSTF